MRGGGRRGLGGREEECQTADGFEREPFLLLFCGGGGGGGGEGKKGEGWGLCVCGLVRRDIFRVFLVHFSFIFY